MLRRDGVCRYVTVMAAVLMVTAVSPLFADEKNLKTVDANAAPDIEIGGKATVEVVDQDGKPVEGCTLIGIGLRSHQDPSTGYGWMVRTHGPHVVAVTDDTGQAELQWPRWVERSQQITTAKISVMADHPDFCLVGHQDVDVANDAVTKITLRRGGRLRLHAFRPDEKKPLTDFRAQISGYYDSLLVWQNVVGGPAGRVSPAMEAGPRLIRLIQPEKDGTLLFSDLLRFESKVGVVEDRLLKLKPAMTVRGQLSDNVTRPVKNGFVVAVVADQIPKTEFDAETLDWQTWRTIDADGTFEIDKLPPAGKVRLLTFCDGYVSMQPRKDDVPEHLKRLVDAFGFFSLPQFFDLTTAGDAGLTVQMERAAVCEIRVVGPGQEPIKGALAGVGPNVVYSSGSTIFGSSGRSEDAMFEPRQSIPDMLKKWDQVFSLDKGKPVPGYLQPRFYAETDAEGLVVIRNLPPRGQQTLFVQHSDFVPTGTEPPFRLQQSVELKPGVTAATTIRMVPKPETDSE